MSPTSDEELGRRRFQLFKEQAVEAAIEKIRRAPAAEWHSFSNAEYILLREILGELWINLEREKWAEYSFSTLTCEDIQALISLGHKARGHVMAGAVIDEMDAILSHSQRDHPPL
jgi:hypothetical protein